MDCFLCNAALKDFFNTVIKEDSQDIGKICNKCNAGWKEFCAYCKNLKKFSDIKYDLKGEITCSECQKTELKVCSECDLRAVFSCSCNEFYCKFCAEIHFVDQFNRKFEEDNSLKEFNHKFLGYGVESYLPDFYEDNLKKLKEFYYENEDYFVSKEINFSRIERMADIYTLGMRIYKSAEYSIDPIDFALIYIQLKFAAGYFVDAKSLLYKILDSVLSNGTQIEGLLNYLIYFTSDLDSKKSTQILETIKSKKKKLSKFKYSLFKAWFSYLINKDKKKIGNFFSKNWKNPVSIQTLQLLTMSGLFTSHLDKLEDCIKYLVFYFQSNPELSLLSKKKSTLFQDPKSKSSSLLSSFQIILRFSDFSNESLIQLIAEYTQNLLPTNPEEAKHYYLRLLEECILNNHQIHLNTLIAQASTYITEPSLINKIQQLSPNPIQ